MLTVSGANNN